MSLQETLTKDQLINHSKHEFKRAGYSLSDENIKSSAFDFIAKKNDLTNIRFKSQKIITKVLIDLDLFKKQASIELQLISKLISGFPLLVAHSAAGKNMEEATLYRRHDVSAVSLETLKMFFQYERGLKEAKISKFSHRGGIYVNLSKERFKERRKRLQMEMTILAKKVGRSRHSLYKYEKGESCPKISTYNNLISILGNDLDIPLDILETKFKILSEKTLKDYEEPHSKLQKEVAIYLADKDFDILWFKSEPFDGLSAPPPDQSSLKGQSNVPHPIITGVTSSNEINDSNRITLINNLSKFLQKKAIWFMEDDMENFAISKEPINLTVVKISDLERIPIQDFKKLLNVQPSNK
jgi:predicted transcriptional regulator